jgi:hypothetical protein
MAKKSRGRAPRDKKPSLKLPEWPCRPKPPRTPRPPRPAGPGGSVPGPDFKKVIKKPKKIGRGLLEKREEPSSTGLRRLRAYLSRVIRG